jgi:hypothetical protein
LLAWLTKDLMGTWTQYSLAFLILCHGFVYVAVGSALPGPIKEWNGTSWLLGVVVHGRLKTLIVGLHVVAGILTIATAVAVGLEPRFAGSWRLPAVIGAGLGLAAFALFWDGQVRLLAQEGAIGAVFSAVLLMAAAAWPSR